MSLWRRLLRTPAARRGLLMLLLVVAVAIAAPLIAPTSPDHLDPGARLLAPLSRSASDAAHPRGMLHLLGTDSVGRDTLSRLIYGSRLSLAVGFAAVVLGALIGTLVGTLSGFFGGIIEAVAGKPDLLVNESADVLYHLLVMWASAGVRPKDVWAELQRREGVSGIAEKASRRALVSATSTRKIP